MLLLAPLPRGEKGDTGWDYKAKCPGSRAHYTKDTILPAEHPSTPAGVWVPWREKQGVRRQETEGHRERLAICTMTSTLWASRGEHKLQATFRAAIWVLRGMKTGDEFSYFFGGLLRASVCLGRLQSVPGKDSAGENIFGLRHRTCFHQPRTFCCRPAPDQ